MPSKLLMPTYCFFGIFGKFRMFFEDFLLINLRRPSQQHKIALRTSNLSLSGHSRFALRRSPYITIYHIIVPNLIYFAEHWSHWILPKYLHIVISGFTVCFCDIYSMCPLNVPNLHSNWFWQKNTQKDLLTEAGRFGMFVNWLISLYDSSS